MRDDGSGVNSDLLAALEWAATPAGSSPCSIGAHVVNLSLATESRPARLNTNSDIDLVSLMVNRLAVRYGTLFVGAAANSQFIGSVHESPRRRRAGAQRRRVGQGLRREPRRHPLRRRVRGLPAGGERLQRRPRLAAGVAQRVLGPRADGRRVAEPDLTAPGYNIVSAQAPTGHGVALADLSPNTRRDPLYASISGTSMATPAAAGSAALLLEAYRDRHGALPSGSSGLSGLTAPAYALVRAALMNSAGSGQLEARVTLSSGLDPIACPPVPNPPFIDFCSFFGITELVGDNAAYQVRNGATDPFVGPLGEGAGKINLPRALAALRDGVVVYSAASGSGQDAGTGPRDLQGSWQVGAIGAGWSRTQTFVAHAAPGVSTSVRFRYAPGHPSDGTAALPASWIKLPSGSTSVRADKKTTVAFRSRCRPRLRPGCTRGRSW